MISEPCLTSLRMAAVLAYRLPLSVRVGSAAGPDACEPMIEVSRPAAEPDPRARWLPPCAFRGAVVEAWRMYQEGRHLAFCGLDDDADVIVDIDVPPGGSPWPGGIYGVPWGDDMLLAFTTTADGDLCREVAAPHGVSVHTDGALDVNLVHVTAAPGELPIALEHLVSVLARLAVEELLSETERGPADHH